MKIHQTCTVAVRLNIVGRFPPIWYWYWMVKVVWTQLLFWKKHPQLALFCKGHINIAPLASFWCINLELLKPKRCQKQLGFFFCCFFPLGFTLPPKVHVGMLGFGTCQQQNHPKSTTSLQILGGVMGSFSKVKTAGPFSFLQIS